MTYALRKNNKKLPNIHISYMWYPVYSQELDKIIYCVLRLRPTFFGITFNELMGRVKRKIHEHYNNSPLYLYLYNPHSQHFVKIPRYNYFIKKIEWIHIRSSYVMTEKLILFFYKHAIFDEYEDMYLMNEIANIII